MDGTAKANLTLSRPRPSRATYYKTRMEMADRDVLRYQSRVTASGIHELGESVANLVDALKVREYWIGKVTKI